MNEVQQERHWYPLDNCASFASETFYKTTGIDIDADSYFDVETPREVGDNIKEKLGGDAISNKFGPLPPAPVRRGTSDK
jgi:hypothetical protein